MGARAPAHRFSGISRKELTHLYGPRKNIGKCFVSANNFGLPKPLEHDRVTEKFVQNLPPLLFSVKSRDFRCNFHLDLTHSASTAYLHTTAPRGRMPDRSV